MQEVDKATIEEAPQGETNDLGDIALRITVTCSEGGETGMKIEGKLKENFPVIRCILEDVRDQYKREIELMQAKQAREAAAEREKNSLVMPLGPIPNLRG